MTLKVAIILPSFAGGGAERVILTLLANLDRARIEPALIVLDGRGPLADLVPAGVPVADLGSPRLRGALISLVGVLRHLRPDVVISTLGYVNVAVLALRPLLKGKPAILVREANAPSASFAAVRFPGLMRLAYRRWYPRADAILCNAGSTADALMQDVGVPRARVHRLANPIDSAALRAQATPPLREPGEGPRFVAAGRLTRQKGLDRLLEMMAALPADAKVKVLGEGPERGSLESQAKQLGVAERVRFTGFEPVPWPHYAGADAFLLPSRWEGMPNAALEALVCGTPIIAAPEAGGIGEVAMAASHGAVTIAECGDPFIAAMMSVEPAPVASPRPSLLPAGFEPHAVAARLTEILEQVASERVTAGKRHELPVL